MQTRKNNRVQTILQILLVVGLCGIGLLIIAGMGAFKQTSTSRSLVFRVKSSEGVSYITFQAAGTAIPDATEFNTPWVKYVDTTVGDAELRDPYRRPPVEKRQQYGAHRRRSLRRNCAVNSRLPVHRKHLTKTRPRSPGEPAAGFFNLFRKHCYCSALVN